MAKKPRPTPKFNPGDEVIYGGQTIHIKSAYAFGKNGKPEWEYTFYVDNPENVCRCLVGESALRLRKEEEI